ncbi:hypothetical protein B0H13DRAFT_2312646 [Mycena leptocephala]|nr:hypothetical protein B0H13DRAFT_2312646 [Mycena leptocephala]
MHSFLRYLLTFVIISSAFFVQVNSEVLETNAERMRRGLPPAPPKRLFGAARVRRSEPAEPQVIGELLQTNAQRMARGLPPAPPKRMFDATRVRRYEPATPSPTLCSQIGSKNMAIELRKTSNDDLIGYVGEGSPGLYNVPYSGFGGTSSNAGLLFNVDPDTPYSAITIAGATSHAFCAEVNQWKTNNKGETVTAHSSQDLRNVDNSYAEPKNYLFNGKFLYTQPELRFTNTAPQLIVSPAGDTINARTNGLISLEWLQPSPSSTYGYDLFPVIWYNPNSGLFRWYPDGVTPTYSGHNNPWIRAMVVCSVVMKWHSPSYTRWWSLH